MSSSSHGDDDESLLCEADVLTLSPSHLAQALGLHLFVIVVVVVVVVVGGGGGVVVGARVVMGIFSLLWLPHRLISSQ